MKAREFFGEFLGTYLLVLFGCGSVAGAVLLGTFNSLFEVAIAWGIAVTLGIYSANTLSQAHLNPAVSFAMLLTGRISGKQLSTYLSGQFAGAFAAAGTLFYMLRTVISRYEQQHQIIRGEAGSNRSAMVFGEFYPNPEFAEQVSLSMPQAMFFEAFGTFLLVLVIFRLTAQANALAPLYIGLTVSLIIMLIAPFTQAGLNPARDLSPRLVAWLAGWGREAFPKEPLSFLVVYVIGPILGSLTAYLAHYGLRYRRPTGSVQSTAANKT